MYENTAMKSVEIMLRRGRGHEGGVMEVNLIGVN
jgi:hypothetical protein